MTARHLLLTAWAFPPARTSGVHRAVGLANAFAARGWDVTVLAAPADVFASNAMVDDSLAEAVDARVVVERVPFHSQAYDNDIAGWSRARARFPELWNGARLARERRVFPEPGFGLWRDELERAAERVHGSHPVDLALGTSNPQVDFIPGWHLHRRFGVPYVMDYRDAWTVDVFSGRDRAAATADERRWEKELIADAARVWFVNDPIRDWHASRHPAAADRMRVVTNGFDVVDGRSPAVPHRPVSDDGVVFGYVGTINYGQFPADALFAGWRRARERDPLVARSRLVLRGHLGRTGVAGEELARQLDEARADGVSYEGPVAKKDLAGVYAGFDALTLALASGPGVTSGKVFEFAATGLPVVSVHDPDSAASAIMSTSPVWEPSRTLAADDVAEAIIRTAHRAVEQTPAERDAAIAWGAQWERSVRLDAAVADAATIVDDRAMVGDDANIDNERMV